MNKSLIVALSAILMIGEMEGSEGLPRQRAKSVTRVAALKGDDRLELMDVYSVIGWVAAAQTKGKAPACVHDLAGKSLSPSSIRELHACMQLHK